MQWWHHRKIRICIVRKTLRAFIAKAFTTVVSSAAVFGMGHVNDNRCNCAICIGGNVANAYYQSDAGDETSSALTKAFNAQAKLTNSRLEAQGFPLDTKEEEERIRNAFQSFSYESNVTKQGIRKSATDNGRLKKELKKYKNERIFERT